MEAQAKGTYEILSKQAQGFEQIVKAAGGEANQAVLLMIADMAGMLKSIPPLDELFKTAGLKLPNYLGQQLNPESAPKDETE
ncbi:MAG: hypothetical protein KGZ79_14590 [Dethiobacter sp.]|jgi:flotillin|nr:hypothetical protein [Dethiobacter sp.]